MGHSCEHAVTVLLVELFSYKSDNEPRFVAAKDRHAVTAQRPPFLGVASAFALCNWQKLQGFGRALRVGISPRAALPAPARHAAATRDLAADATPTELRAAAGPVWDEDTMGPTPMWRWLLICAALRLEHAHEG
jgi:hypothetical protein